MSYAAKAYANTKSETDVSTSSSPELILVVYERLFDHLKAGKKELEAGRYGIEPFSKASDLINIGLLACLDIDKGKDIANNLRLIYNWALTSILQARLKRSPDLIQKVIDVLTPVYEGWLNIIPKNSSQALKPSLQFLETNNRPLHTGHGFQLA
jgi:flagellar protein FliS